MKKVICLILALVLSLFIVGCDDEEPILTQHTHTECEYCGNLEGNDRWFIAKATTNGKVMPLGNGCFEAVSAMDAGISLHYSAVDGDPDKRLTKGDVVRITYNGLVMETYPVQISASSVEIVK